MNILQFSCYSSWGGAPRVAYRIHKYINSIAGSSAHMFCRTQTDNDEKIQPFYKGTLGRVHRVAIDKFESLVGLQYFFQKSFNNISGHDWFKTADVVHFHNTHGGYLNQWFLTEVAKRKPVVWTFHDMWALTGSCAHSYDCEKWKTGCGRCPYKSVYPPSFIDTSAFLWKLKQKLYSEVDINIVCPSLWLYKKLPDSFLGHCKSMVIRNGIDLSVFKPYGKMEVRKNLGLPTERLILLFAAQGGIGSKLKGFGYLVEALVACYKMGLKPYILVAGNKKQFNFDRLGIDGKCLGSISDEDLMAKYYSAADALVLPSIAENIPLVIAESLACGTPAIASGIGGIPEMIDNKETGYLAEPKNVCSIVAGIKWLMRLESEQLRIISRKCREKAEKEYSLDAQIEKYINLYNSVIN